MNNRVFQIIDAKEKAYWLGFLLADGGISGNSVRLILAEGDLDQILRFAKFLGIENPDVRLYGPYKSNKQRQAHFYINSPDMVSDLAKYSCVPNKTLKIRFPHLSNRELDLALLAGFYDGDGHEKKPIITCGKIQFIDDIVSRFDLSTKVSFRKGKYGSSWSVSIGKVYREMIENYPDSMPRKRKNYKENHTSAGMCFESRRRFDVTAEELKKLVWSISVRSVGKMFGVSGRAVKKRCDLMGIPTPPRGYWSGREGSTP